MADRHASLNAVISDRWGKGITRRAIALSGKDGRVEAALEDHCHAMRCVVHHDGRVVTAVDADFQRYTLNHCPGAIAPLQELVGLPVDISTTDLFAGGRARRNCTHMLDLAWLAVRHIRRGLVDRRYEMEIPDAVSGPMRGRLLCDGAEVMAWTTEDDILTAPERFAGRPLWAGFVRWAGSEAGLSDDALEYALVLHKGFFMTGARRLELPTGPRSAAGLEALSGVCFGYAPESLATAIGEEGVFRDFTDTPEKLLRFE